MGNILNTHAETIPTAEYTQVALDDVTSMDETRYRWKVIIRSHLGGLANIKMGPAHKTASQLSSFPLISMERIELDDLDRGHVERIWVQTDTPVEGEHVFVSLFSKEVRD